MKKITKALADELINLISETTLDYVVLKRLFDNNPDELGSIIFTKANKDISKKKFTYRCKIIWNDYAKYKDIVNLPQPAPATAQPVTMPLIYASPAAPTPEPKHKFIVEISNKDELNKFIALTASLQNSSIKAVA